MGAIHFQTCLANCNMARTPGAINVIPVLLLCGFIHVAYTEWTTDPPTDATQTKKTK